MLKIYGKSKIWKLIKNIFSLKLTNFLKELKFITKYKNIKKISYKILNLK